MTCADFEIPICDYVDGTLDAARTAEVERHLAQCPACAALARDSAAAVAFIERAADVEPPPQLMARILFDAPWNIETGRSGKHSWMAAILGPVWNPRIVMGCAMTVLSVSMLAGFVGPLKPLKAGDLKPAAVWSEISTRADYALDTRREVLRRSESRLPDSDHHSEVAATGRRPALRRCAEFRAQADDHKLPVRPAPGPGSTPPSAGGSK